MRPPAVASALAGLALVLAGCGGGDGGQTAAGAGRPAEGGTLQIALAADPGRLDPLYATDRASQVVTRQIHEPLTETLSGPFGGLRGLPGLARSSSASRDRTIWRFRLRRRIRFGDGTPFNASAVLANADRWLAASEGRGLLPDLLAVDAPRPDLVRFILDRADRTLPEQLAHPRLGLVSPRALPAAGTDRGVDVDAGGTGTGAFELREQEAGATTVLARNVEWWGTRLELGPALDQLVFTVVPDGRERAAMLVAGRVELADELPARAAAEVRSDPLLAVESAGPGPSIGFERSVRGLAVEAGVPVLSGVWLTRVGAGE